MSCVSGAAAVSYLCVGRGVLGKERTFGLADVQETRLLTAAVLLSPQTLRFPPPSGVPQLWAVATRQRAVPAPRGATLGVLSARW